MIIQINNCILKYNENSLLTGHIKNGIGLYDLNNPEKPIIKTKKDKSKGYISSIDWYPQDTGMFATGSTDKTVKVFINNYLDMGHK